MYSKRDASHRSRSNVTSPHVLTRTSNKASQRSYSQDFNNLTDQANEKKELKPEVKLIVGETDSDHKTLAEALEVAAPGTIIKINEGYYHTNVKIKTPGLRIEPRHKDKAVYLLGEEGPSITIDLNPGETCVIRNLILAHFGSNIANKFSEQVKYQELLTATPKFLKQFDINKDMDCVVMVLGGDVILKNCMLSLKSLPENIKSSVPVLVSMSGSRLNVVSSEFRGNEAIMTAGAIIMHTDLLISDCKFHNFKAGGLFFSGTNDTNIKISDTSVSRCGIVGIYSQGRDCLPLLLRLKIDNIDGPGIKVYKANRAKIKGCELTKCQIGLEVMCGGPFILLNKIYK